MSYLGLDVDGERGNVAWDANRGRRDGPREVEELLSFGDSHAGQVGSRVVEVLSKGEDLRLRRRYREEEGRGRAGFGLVVMRGPKIEEWVWGLWSERFFAIGRFKKSSNSFAFS